MTFRQLTKDQKKEALRLALGRVDWALAGEVVPEENRQIMARDLAHERSYDIETDERGECKLVIAYN